MSVAGAIKPPAAAGPTVPRWRRFAGNIVGWFAGLLRAPCPPAAGRFWTAYAWRTPRRLAVKVLLALVMMVAMMMWLDAPTIIAVRSQPLWISRLFNELTDFGTSNWILVPTGVVLIAIAVLASSALSRFSQGVLAVLAVRFGFVFAAVGLSGLFVTIVKRLIGRARPFVGGHADPFLYDPSAWTPAYASLPSGHATNVFAALIAVGLIWPRMRWIMLVYALIIAASRVLVLAHHPSDVLGGAIVGSVGALLLRDWLAARRLGFAVGAGGEVRVLPGPSWRRLKQVARQFWAA